MTTLNTSRFSFSRIMSFWNEDRSLSVMFILLLIFIFVLVPLLDPGRIGQLIIRVVYSLMLFTAILSVTREAKYLTVFSIIALICLILAWVVDYFPSTTLFIIGDISTIIFNLLFALAILYKTFKEGEITYQRIEGSIVVFLLVGLMFSYVYHAIYLFAGPKSFNNITAGELREFLYFSFTSMTTAGYGDITPSFKLARSLANLEGLFGQLFPAILIARLVSMEFEASTKKRKEKIR